MLNVGELEPTAMSCTDQSDEELPMHPHPIPHFWFTEIGLKQHFAKDPALDLAIRTRFCAMLEAAARCERFPWRAMPKERPAAGGGGCGGVGPVLAQCVPRNGLRP